MIKAKFTSDAYDPDAILRGLERSVLPVDPAIPSDETLEKDLRRSVEAFGALGPVEPAAEAANDIAIDLATVRLIESDEPLTNTLLPSLRRLHGHLQRRAGFALAQEDRASAFLLLGFADAMASLIAEAEGEES